MITNDATVQEKADALRKEAKYSLNMLFNIHNDVSSGLVERFVDCVIGAAMLEISALNTEAITMANKK